MIQRASLGLLLVLIMMVGTQRFRAQARWSVWVYQPDSGRLQRVDNNGQVMATQSIPSVGDDLYPTEVVISPNGTLLAYQPPRLQQIIVMELATGTRKATISLSEIGAIHTDEDALVLDDIAFTNDDTHLVYWERLAGFGWQIHAHDVVNDVRVATLAYGDAQTYAYPALHGGIQPQIIHLSGDRVTFLVDIEYPTRIHSYHWFYTSDILSETIASPTHINASNPFQGDIISVQYDNRFPTNNEDFRNAWQQVNTLFAYTGIEGRFPVFFEPDLSFEQLWLVQGGERILAQAYVDEIVDVYVLIERDGNEIRRYPAVGRDTTATPDGYIYATEVEGQTAIVNVDTRNSTSAGSTLWLQPNEWRIVWAGINQAQAQILDWVQLAQSEEDPTGIVSRQATPTQAPDLPAFRRIGMPIQIYVPEEGFLNLRDAPTTNSNVVTLLESGARGVISGGPVEQGDNVGIGCWGIT
ncbi:MAG: hypothetical protein AAFV93_14050 [Chloroflexota bacterium]